MEMPREEIEKAEKARQRALLEDRFATYGDVDVEGVPDQLKARFAYEKRKAVEQDINRLWKEAERIEAIERQHTKDDYFDAPPLPEEAEARQRALLEDRFATYGDVDVEGVPDQLKARFAYEKRRALERGEMARLWREADRIEALERQHERPEGEDASPVDAPRAVAETSMETTSVAKPESGFTETEERWFEKGTDPKYLRKAALAEAWETQSSLDVEDVPAREKVAFADEKIAHLRLKARNSMSGRTSDELKERLARLELLRQQYAKEAETAGPEKPQVEEAPAQELSFEPDEEQWFAEGLDPRYVRKTALVDAWESMGTLDVDDVPAVEKFAFAEERLGQLRDLQKTEKYRNSETLKERIARLELLRDQYGKQAQAERTDDVDVAA